MNLMIPRDEDKGLHHDKGDTACVRDHIYLLHKLGRTCQVTIATNTGWHAISTCLFSVSQCWTLDNLVDKLVFNGLLVLWCVWSEDPAPCEFLFLLSLPISLATNMPKRIKTSSPINPTKMKKPMEPSHATHVSHLLFSS